MPTAAARDEPLTDGSEGADLIVLRPQGLYCPAGDFYIDPWRPVDRAVITHAHADHARPGHRHYLCSAEGAGLLRARLGNVSLQTLAWGEPLHWQGVRVSLHPAGHVLGSAQVRIEHRGQVWVASGDYYSAGTASTTPAARPSRRNAATVSSPNPPSGCRSTAGGRRPRCWPTSTPGGKATPTQADRAC